MLIERAVNLATLPNIELTRLDSANNFLQDVAKKYFNDWTSCRMVTDISRCCESLVDEIYVVQTQSGSVDGAPLVQLIRMLVSSRVRFLLWYGARYEELPIVHTVTQVIESISSQTRERPVDLYLYFEPLNFT